MSPLDPVLVPAVITAASATTPGPRASITYAARSSSITNVYAVSGATPINSHVPNGNTTVNIVPAAVGDPCILIRVGGVTKLVTLTERLEFAQCP